MKFEIDTIRGFNSYCSKKRMMINQIRNKEQKACQEKVLIARSLLYREAADMVEAYTKYITILDNKSEVNEFMNKIREIDGMDIKKEFIRECEIRLRLSDYQSSQIWKLQEALLGVICAGLEDISFSKWQANMADAVEAASATDQARRLPSFLKACAAVTDSLDIDLSDVEEELRSIFESECIYNTLVLTVTAVKSYYETLENAYEKQKTNMKHRYRKMLERTHSHN